MDDNEETGYTCYTCYTCYNVTTEYNVSDTSENIMNIKIDESTKYRLAKYGGGIYIYTIKCCHCDVPLFEYQKDGSGILKRCYEDRILKLYEFFTYNANANADTNINTLGCKKCNKSISHAKSLYEKSTDTHNEKRYAYELIS